MTNKIKTSKSLQNSYDKQYTERMTTWRELGAKKKSQNILKVVEGKSFQKVLDFGAGEGSILKNLDNNPQFKSLYALEISDSGIAQIENRNLHNLKEVRKFDGYNSGYLDGEFDLVYCSHVIEHVEHPRLVLREIQRISKFQVFEIPLDYNKKVDEQITHFLGYGHINIYTPSLFKFLLKSEGFVIHKEEHSSFEKEMLEFGWYQNKGLKKTIKRRVLSFLFVNKSKIATLLFGKATAREFYHSSYTCFTSNTGGLKIF